MPEKTSTLLVSVLLVLLLGCGSGQGVVLDPIDSARDLTDTIPGPDQLNPTDLSEDKSSVDSLDTIEELRPDPDLQELIQDPCLALTCGDGTCSPECAESAGTCPQDCCLEACGDGACTPTCGEDPATCPDDCCATACGDGVCDAVCRENIAGSTFCSSDCCRCGDGLCHPWCGEAWNKNLHTCATDCAICGDGVCDPGESTSICPTDCCGFCGDGACRCLETFELCPEDCIGAICGNGDCEPGENPVDCKNDCNPYECGNGSCEPGESPQLCPVDCANTCGDCECSGGESWGDCPLDCGFCGDGYCISLCPHLVENAQSCPADCCQLDCTGKECGDNGCGGTCGECETGKICSQGLCQACTPDCQGRACGPDGCGGSCGACPTSSVCLADGSCTGCTPDCQGRVCGSNGCGGSCGTCGQDQVCLTDGTCLCIPNCAGKICGDDGCGNSCGECPESTCFGLILQTQFSCVANQCVPEAVISCDDGNACTDDLCHPGDGCLHQNNFAVCSDGDPCTMIDRCEDGSCRGSSPMACDDGNPCTEDLCQNGCLHLPLAQPCDDGNECTSGDTCIQGICTGTGSVACDDGNPCTRDYCLENGGCDHTWLEGACLDMSPCTVNDYCLEGQCLSGEQLNCDDGNPCTEDYCDSGGSCRHNLLSGPPCDDGNPCTQLDQCQQGLCQPLAFTDCDDQNPCTRDYCNPSSGCIWENLSGSCEDGNLCTLNDHCQDGICVSGIALFCQDGNPCTDDICNPSQGCSYVFNSNGCEDGNLCTTGDRCSFGICVEGSQRFCDDGEFCNGVEFCDPALGCRPGTAPPVNDQISCTLDYCDNVLQQVVHDPISDLCDDHDSCNGVEICNTIWGCIQGAPPAVDDGIKCTEDICNPSTGDITHIPRDDWCDDLAFCNGIERCDPGQGGCVSPGIQLDDGFSCTLDYCNESEDLVAHIPMDSLCDDGLFCNGPETCSISQGCLPATATAQPTCDDGDPCTVDVCNADLPGGGGCQNTFETPGDTCETAIPLGALGGAMGVDANNSCMHDLYYSPCGTGIVDQVFSVEITQPSRITAFSSSTEAWVNLAPSNGATCNPYPTTCGAAITTTVKTPGIYYIIVDQVGGTPGPYSLITEVTPLKADGESCTVDQSCLSNHCQNGICCGQGGDCCLSETDCSTYNTPSYCFNSTTCQGSRTRAQCTDFMCSSVHLDDDTGCAADYLAKSCTPYAPRYCTGALDQSPPACPTSCGADQDCDPNFYCTGGTCQPKLENGRLCTLPGSCISGYCVDGTCCNNACEGLCNTCANPTGSCSFVPSGQDPAADCGDCFACDGAGLCVPVEVNQDPKDNCPQDPEITCLLNGFCDGSGQCALWDGLTECIAPGCLSGTNIIAGYCDGRGSPCSPIVQYCYPYQCAPNGLGCLTSCTTSSDCVTSCNAGVCLTSG